MARKLRKAVVSGGVVYPAGATPPAEVADAITADVWAEEKAAPKSEAKVEEPAKKAPARKPRKG